MNHHTEEDTILDRMNESRDAVVTSSTLVVVWITGALKTIKNKKEQRNLKRGLRHANAALRIAVSSKVPSSDQNLRQPFVADFDEMGSVSAPGQPVLEWLPSEPEPHDQSPRLFVSGE